MIFVDTNVVSETLRKSPSAAVIARLVRYDAERALPTVAIAEISFGIQKIIPALAAAGTRAERLAAALCRSDIGLTEEAALAYGKIMGTASHQGVGMSAPDGMIASIARVNGSRLATRNLTDFRTTGLERISPWEF